MAQHQLVGKAYEANRLQGLGTYRKHRTLHEHDGFGEGVACGNDLDDLFLAVSGNAVELDLATLHQIEALGRIALALEDRKSTRLNSSHVRISYAVFCLKKKK